MIELKPGERFDDLERNGYKIIQTPSKFCFWDGCCCLVLHVVKPGRRGGLILGRRYRYYS